VHPNVTREGTMREITVTIIKGKNGTGRFSVQFKWTGGDGQGGTWSGNQSAMIVLMSAAKQPLQTIPVAINRSGCFYGGNPQNVEGDLSIDPDLVAQIGVTLTEVQRRKEGLC